MEQQGIRNAAKSVKPLELQKVTASEPQKKDLAMDDMPPTVRVFYGPRGW
jgi:hypothetical protein